MKEIPLDLYSPRTTKFQLSFDNILLAKFTIIVIAFSSKISEAGIVMLGFLKLMAQFL